MNKPIVTSVIICLPSLSLKRIWRDLRFLRIGFNEARPLFISANGNTAVPRRVVTTFLRRAGLPDLIAEVGADGQTMKGDFLIGRVADLGRILVWVAQFKSTKTKYQDYNIETK